MDDQCASYIVPLEGLFRQIIEEYDLYSTA